MVCLEWIFGEESASGNRATKDSEKLPVKLSQDQAFTLLEVSYNYPYECNFLRLRNYAVMGVFIFCGLRRSELLNLRVQDVVLSE